MHLHVQMLMVSLISNEFRQFLINLFFPLLLIGFIDSFEHPLRQESVQFRLKINVIDLVVPKLFPHGIDTLFVIMGWYSDHFWEG